MIIVEGMDGTGKSHLVSRICSTYGIPIHERASDSISGPVDNLYEWAMNDVATLPTQPMSVYDRHPFISQFIYAPILGRNMDERFFTPECRNASRRLFRSALVIFCDPGIAQVAANVTTESEDGQPTQMSGVEAQYDDLYNGYRVVHYYWPYPDRSFVWDYRNPGSWETLHHLIASHIANGRHARG